MVTRDDILNADKDLVELPEELYTTLFVPGWNLGNVRVSEQTCLLIEFGGATVDGLLAAYLAHDYGRISLDATDHARTEEARRAGRRFQGFYGTEKTAISIVTEVGHRLTTVCLFGDR